LTKDDIIYIQSLLETSVIKGPCLELGVGYEGQSLKQLLTGFDLEYYGTDMVTGAEVDFVINFEESIEKIRNAYPTLPVFQSIFVLNVLEHCFNPIKVLDNVFELLAPEGKCIISTPTIWPIHNFPIDCWRPLPDFYRQYAAKNGHCILQKNFAYIGFGPVDSFKKNGVDVFPSVTESQLKRTWSRVVHKLLNTTGRGVLYPSHVAIGAVLIKKSI
jgi:SAM-dependent methyltransferase